MLLSTKKPSAFFNQQDCVNIAAKINIWWFSVIKINRILMQYFLKKSNLMQKTHDEQDTSIFCKDGVFYDCNLGIGNSHFQAPSVCLVPTWGFMKIDNDIQQIRQCWFHI